MTGETPVRLVFAYKPKTCLDLVNNKIVRSVEFSSVGKSVDIPDERIFEKNCVKKKKELIVYSINEIVSYQIVWNNVVKWVPAKVIKKISPCVYVVLVNGSSRLAQLRQLKKCTAKALQCWPGIFEHKFNDIIEQNQDIVCNNNNDVSISRKRIRSPVHEMEVRRSERLAKIRKPCYKS